MVECEKHEGNKDKNKVNLKRSFSKLTQFTRFPRHSQTCISSLSPFHVFKECKQAPRREIHFICLLFFTLTPSLLLVHLLSAFF